MLVICFLLLGRPIDVLAAEAGAAPQESEGGGTNPDGRSGDRPETIFKPINLSDQNFPLLSQYFPNITLAEPSTKKMDVGADKLVEETKHAVLQGINVTELYLYRGDFNLNNSLLVFQVKLIQPKVEE